MVFLTALALASTSLPPGTYSPLPGAVAGSQIAGTVGLALGIDERGAVTSCAVRQSSGLAILDAATCRLLVTRHFKLERALTLNGRPTTAVIEMSVPWRMLPQTLMHELSGTPR